MKKFIFIIINVLLLSNCIGQSFLNKTVWINITPVKNDDISGKIINTMIFTGKDSVYIFSTANVDSVVLYPINTANGTFLYAKKKSANLSVITNNGNSVVYNVKKKKKDKLILTGSDGLYEIYRKTNLMNNHNPKNK